MRKTAMHYIKHPSGDIICGLCPHNCRIKEGNKGICGVRKYEKGVFESINYGEVSSLALDPIEKKPLYHYKPGSYITSVGSFGCNFDCGFCQNHGISRESPETREMEANELVALAEKMKKDGSIGIAFTYNEPSIWYEYVLECAEKCQERNMDVILVTNGYVNREPLEGFKPYVNAMNIDLKAFNEDFYKNVCKGSIKSVLNTIEYANSFCHVEIATLLIGGYNDEPKEISELSKWIASINPDIPLHLSRYHPAYKFEAPPTPIESIYSCAKLAREYLHHVYIGNVYNAPNDTYCYNCGEKLIERGDFGIKSYLDSSKCPKCGVKINIIL